MNALSNTMSRRELLRQSVVLGLGISLPWVSQDVLSASSVIKSDLSSVPLVPFKKIKNGVSCYYGEVTVARISDEFAPLPVLVKAADGLAFMDFSSRTPVVRFGSDSSAIILSAKGIRFGKAKFVSWSKSSIKELIHGIAQDPKKVQGASLLRATLYSAYPIAVNLEKPFKAVDQQIGKAFTNGTKSLGADAFSFYRPFGECVTETVIETIVTTVTETVDVIKTATEQWNACMASVTQEQCGFVPVPICAAGICAAQAFVDIVTGFITVVNQLVSTVIREVTTCTVDHVFKKTLPVWPNPWHFPGSKLPASAAISQASNTFTLQDINQAKTFLNNFAGFLGPFANCLVEAEWSFAQLEIEMNVDGKVIIPYGIKAGLNAKCASQLTLGNMLFPGAAAWTSALTLLAALSPEFAASTGGLLVVSASLAAAVAALTPPVAAVAALILGFIILALLYGTAISAQLTFHKFFTDNFDDGIVYIEHATFALALIKLASFTLIPAELVPPIVTG